MKGIYIMANTIGNAIGKIIDTFSITNNRGASTTLRIEWDFSGASDTEIKSWLAGNRRIAFQRPSRALSVDELNELDGSTIAASNAGKKTMSRSERIDNLVNAGIPLKLAEIAVDNPALLETVNVPQSSTETE
jgi:hypothetical protein